MLNQDFSWPYPSLVGKFFGTWPGENLRRPRGCLHAKSCLSAFNPETRHPPIPFVFILSRMAAHRIRPLVLLSARVSLCRATDRRLRKAGRILPKARSERGGGVRPTCLRQGPSPSAGVFVVRSSSLFRQGYHQILALCNMWLESTDFW